MLGHSGGPLEQQDDEVHTGQVVAVLLVAPISYVPHTTLQSLIHGQHLVWRALLLNPWPVSELEQVFCVHPQSVQPEQLALEYSGSDPVQWQAPSKLPAARRLAECASCAPEEGRASMRTEASGKPLHLVNLRSWMHLGQVKLKCLQVRDVAIRELRRHVPEQGLEMVWQLNSQMEAGHHLGASRSPVNFCEQIAGMRNDRSLRARTLQE